MSRNNPKYSIIVPVYNRESEVADLLTSLGSQKCRDFETIIVEDLSLIHI
ncbi:MAG: glycosyltransferase [Paramuribaculum sp.]|nr:glycosyltransferase [Paramuribaculum sp.]